MFGGRGVGAAEKLGVVEGFGGAVGASRVADDAGHDSPAFLVDQTGT